MTILFAVLTVIFAFATIAEEDSENKFIVGIAFVFSAGATIIFRYGG